MTPRWTLLVAVLCVALLVYPSAALASNAEQMISQTNDQLNNAVAQAHFLTDTTPSQALTDFANEAPTFESALQKAIIGFQNAGRATSNTTLRGYANKLAQATDGMATAVVGMVNALAAQDSDGLQTATNELDTSVSQYTSAADGYNTYVEGPSSSPAKAPWEGNFIIFLVISAGLLVACVAVWARTSVPEGDARAKGLKGRRGELALASLLPVAGSVSSYIWYRSMVRHGGTYALLYIPIIVGFIALGILFVVYRRAVQALAPGSAPAGPSTPAPVAAPVAAVVDEADDTSDEEEPAPPESGPSDD
ncbi:MAG: hypothetical protein ACRDJU_11705 [Actinomycetota bacterium]